MNTVASDCGCWWRDGALWACPRFQPLPEALNVGEGAHMLFAITPSKHRLFSGRPQMCWRLNKRRVHLQQAELLAAHASGSPGLFKHIILGYELLKQVRSTSSSPLRSAEERHARRG